VGDGSWTVVKGEVDIEHACVDVAVLDVLVGCDVIAEHSIFQVERTAYGTNESGTRLNLRSYPLFAASTLPVYD